MLMFTRWLSWLLLPPLWWLPLSSLLLFSWFARGKGHLQLQGCSHCWGLYPISSNFVTIYFSGTSLLDKMKTFKGDLSLYATESYDGGTSVNLWFNSTGDIVIKFALWVLHHDIYIKSLFWHDILLATLQREDTVSLEFVCFLRDF